MRILSKLATMADLNLDCINLSRAIATAHERLAGNAKVETYERHVNSLKELSDKVAEALAKLKTILPPSETSKGTDRS